MPWTIISWTDKLNERRAQDAFRRLRLPEGKTDFCSNDYLGVSQQHYYSETRSPSPRMPAIQSRATRPPLLQPVRGPRTPLRHGSGGSSQSPGRKLPRDRSDGEATLALFHRGGPYLISVPVMTPA